MWLSTSRCTTLPVCTSHAVAQTHDLLRGVADRNHAVFVSKNGCAATSLFSQSGRHAGGVHPTRHSDKARGFWSTLLVLYDCWHHSHHHSMNEQCGAGMMMSGGTCAWWWGTTLATASKSSPALAKAALARCDCLSYLSACTIEWSASSAHNPLLQ